MHREQRHTAFRKRENGYPVRGELRLDADCQIYQKDPILYPYQQRSSKITWFSIKLFTRFGTSVGSLLESHGVVIEGFEAHNGDEASGLQPRE